jgi:DNA-directed RNA polymerase subunit A"
MSDLYTPRSLTQAEIEDILSGIEPNRLGIPSASKLAQDEIKNVLRKQLKSIELVPSGIPEMKRVIRQKYNRAIMEPETAVGFLVSEALAAPITQMTLNSVIGETQIVVGNKDTKAAKVVQIGEWIDGLLKENKDKIVNIPENRTEYLQLERPVLIPSTTCDGKSEWMELTAVTRHLPVGDLIKIKTRSGREVTATSQKSFLVYDEKEDTMVEKDGLKLKMGDLVGIHLGLENEPLQTHLILRNYLSPLKYVYGTEVEKFEKQYNMDKAGKQVPSNWWSEHRNATFTLPFGRNDSILYSVKKNTFEPGMIYPKMSNMVKNRIPEVFPLDRELGYIMGLYLAEGFANKTQLIFSNNAPEVLKPVEHWCKKMNVGYHIQVQTDKNFKGATTTDLRIHSTLLCDLFIQLMGVLSHNKRIPSEALNGPLDFVVGILDGYITGDGCVNKDDGSITASSVSKDLIVGINFLLTRLGIMAKISGYQSKKNNIGSKNILYSHTLSIRNGFAKAFAEQVKLTSSTKQERLEQITLTKEYKSESGIYFKKWRDIILEPIVEISSVSSENKDSELKFVYDVTVPKSLNFNLFNGLIMAD